ncbi:MAG: LysO family transporter [Eubacteriales bacterium]|nr:LysO family transporter [Eubacteriales bacterium]
MSLLASMSLLLAVLGAGWALGRWIKLPAKGQKALSLAQSICIWVLIFTMGVRLGADEKVLANFATLGWRALVITVLAVAGSVALAYVTAKLLNKREEKR